MQPNLRKTSEVVLALWFKADLVDNRVKVSTKAGTKRLKCDAILLFK